MPAKCLNKRVHLNRYDGESVNLNLRGPMAKCKESMRSLNKLIRARKNSNQEAKSIMRAERVDSRIQKTQ